MYVQNLVSKFLASDIFAGETAKARKTDQTASPATGFPSSQCRATLIEIIRKTPATSEVTLAGRQFALNMVLRDGQLFSFRILQRKSSTVWMHFFGPKTIFDATKGAYNAITVQREINTAINTFSLFSDVCRITVKPVATDIRHLNGLDAEFLAAPNRAYNLQDVNPIAAARPARIDYTAYRARRDLKDESAAAPLPSTDLPKVATAERMVALLKNSIESPGGEPNNGTLLLDKPARKGLEKMAHPSVTQDSLPEIAPRPIYRHRQRLHLS